MCPHHRPCPAAKRVESVRYAAVLIAFAGGRGRSRDVHHESKLELPGQHRHERQHQLGRWARDQQADAARLLQAMRGLLQVRDGARPATLYQSALQQQDAQGHGEEGRGGHADAADTADATADTVTDASPTAAAATTATTTTTAATTTATTTTTTATTATATTTTTATTTATTGRSGSLLWRRPVHDQRWCGRHHATRNRGGWRR